jgi:hypothetical protein
MTDTIIKKVKKEIDGHYELSEGSGMGRGLYNFSRGDWISVWFNLHDLEESLESERMLDELDYLYGLDNQ